MEISEKRLIANRLNFKKCNDLGLNRHFGENNTSWNNGNRLKGNYPCPQCGKERVCEKRHSYRLCRECSNKSRNLYKIHYQDGTYRETYKRKRHNFKKFAFEYKGSKCAQCGVSNLPLCCYQFHHLKNKKEHIGALLRQTNKQILIDELDKCIMLCANCHLATHWKDSYE